MTMKTRVALLFVTFYALHSSCDGGRAPPWKYGQEESTYSVRQVSGARINVCYTINQSQRSKGWRMCCQGYGYMYRGYTGGWFDLGCTTCMVRERCGRLKGCVPWSTVPDPPAVRCKVLGPYEIQFNMNAGVKVVP